MQAKAVLTDVHLPILPLQNVPIHLEADSFRLDDMERLDIRSGMIAALFGFLHQIREEIPGFPRRRDTLTPRRGKRVRGHRGRSSAVRSQLSGAIGCTSIMCREIWKGMGTE